MEKLRYPDTRIRQALGLVFRKLPEFGSVRQVLVWIRQERIELPAVSYESGGAISSGSCPVYNTLLHILTNPTYGGAYAFGRTRTIARIVNGRKQVFAGRPLRREDWQALIIEHHEGYISWDEYEANRKLITHNANMKGNIVHGAVKRGSSLLAGLLRCGHCVRKLHVAYSGTKGTVARYNCQGSMINHGGPRCISFGAVGAALEQARYEAARARRQYDAIDPENRLVAAELERRWEETLKMESRLQAKLDSMREHSARALSAGAREELMRLGDDLPRLWNHPASSVEIKKRILRTVLKEIVVTKQDETIRALVHWQGGDHTQIVFEKNHTGQHRWTTDVETIEIVRALARTLPDQGITAIINRLGKRTARGHTWTAARVCSLRKHHGIATYREGVSNSNCVCVRSCINLRLRLTQQRFATSAAAQTAPCADPRPRHRSVTPRIISRIMMRSVPSGRFPASPQAKPCRAGF
jgi:hypothetical protein